jgi:hypothetical protein
MNRDAFAENIVIADADMGGPALPLQILRLQPDGGERENLIPLAQGGVSVHDRVGMQPAVFAERDVFADDAIRPDDAARRDLGLRMNDGSGMNHEIRFYRTYNLWHERQLENRKSQIINRKFFRRRGA